MLKQIEGSYEAKGEKMTLYLRKVQELIKKFVQVHIKHVSRSENSRADALARLATASQENLDRLILVECLAEPSVEVLEEVFPVQVSSSWMDVIRDYL